MSTTILSITFYLSGSLLVLVEQGCCQGTLLDLQNVIPAILTVIWQQDHSNSFTAWKEVKATTEFAQLYFECLILLLCLVYTPREVLWSVLEESMTLSEICSRSALGDTYLGPECLESKLLLGQIQNYAELISYKRSDLRLRSEGK